MTEKRDLRSELQTGIGVVAEDDDVLDYGICINNEKIMWKSGGFDRIWEDFDKELYSIDDKDYKITTLVRDINSFSDIENGRGIIIWQRSDDEKGTVPIKIHTLETMSKKLSFLTDEIMNLHNEILEIYNEQESE